MTDYQQIVDEIQNALHSFGSADADLLRDVAVEYTEACNTVNDRLKQVSRLLRKGLRSEAIQLAEREPNLLDAVELLDFPELALWHDLLKGWSMILPPGIDIEAAGDLNQAYAIEQPLEALLKSHRLLALGRAPLAARVRTLRHIRKADPDNPVWQEDAAVLERARLAEITLAVDQATRCNDWRTVASFAPEVDNNGWVHPPPAALVGRVREATELARTHQARARVREIEQRLSAAQATFDVTQAQLARSEWESHIEVARLPSDHELIQRATVALQWLAEQERQEEQNRQYGLAVEDLEQALSDNQPPEELQQRYETAHGFGIGLPGDLDARYEQRMLGFVRASRRKRLLVVLAMLLIGVSLGGAVAGLVVYKQFRARIIARSGEMALLTDSGDWDEAAAFYDDLEQSDPPVAASDEVQREKARLDELVANEQQRAAAFRTAMDTATNAGVEHPDRDALKEAGKLARTEAEETELAEFQSLITGAINEARQARDDAFAASLDMIRVRVDELSEEGEGTTAQTQAELKRLIVELDTLVDANRLVSNSVLREAEPVRAQIEALQTDASVRQAQDVSRRRITESVGDLRRFRLGLEEFAQEHPDSTSARDFKQALGEANLWSSMLAWQQATSNGVFDDPRKVGTQQADTLVEKANVLLTSHAISPLCDDLSERLDYFKRVAGRVDQDGQKIDSSLDTLFQDPLINGIWMVKLKTGEQYYMAGQPPKPQSSSTGNVVVIEYFSDFNLTPKRKAIKADSIEYSGIAPQTRLARQVTSSLATMKAGVWEKKFYDILRMIHNDRETDPVLRLLLIKRILPVACQGSHCLHQAFSKNVSLIDNAAMDFSVPWMVPDDDQAKFARIQAQSVLDRLEFEQAAKEAGRRLQLLLASPMDQFKWIGWLGRDSASDWNCFRPNISETPSGQLVVVRQGNAAAGNTLDVAGEIDNGSIKWATEHSTAFLQGRPLFLKIAADSKR